MVPVGRMIVVRNTEKSQLMRAISTITWSAIVAPVTGPTIGGAITTCASWHWIFFLNVPFGILSLILILCFVPSQQDATPHILDILGFLLAGSALGMLLYGTELASQLQSNLLLDGGVFFCGIIFGILAIRHANFARDPLLNLTTLEVPTFSVTVVSGSVSRIGIDAVPYLSPLLFRLGFGLSPFRSGLLLLATAIGNLGMKIFTTRILKSFGFRDVALINIIIAAVFIGACGWLVPTTPIIVMVAVLFLYGLARSLQFTTLATLAYADVSDPKGARQARFGAWLSK